MSPNIRDAQERVAHWLRTRSRLLLFVIALLSVSIILLLARGNQGRSLEKIAEDMLMRCATTDSHTACYDREIPKLTEEGISMEDAFKIVKIIQEKDDTYWFCHLLGHTLSSKEYDRDPQAWRDVLARCPVGQCSNGCLHGVIQKRFSSESVPPDQIQLLIPELAGLCEPGPRWPNPTNQQVSSCYHEIGHLSLYVTGADVPRAIALCDAVGVKPDGRNYLQTCYEGLFMQIFQPQAADDFALVYKLIRDPDKLAECEQYPTGSEKGRCWAKHWTDYVDTFCEQFPEGARNGCFRESFVTRPANNEQVMDPGYLSSYCSYAKTKEEKYLCYNKIFYTLMVRFDFNENKLISLCDKFRDDELRGQCFSNTASRMIETDHRLVARSLAVCAKAAEGGVGDQCYEGIIYYIDFVFPQGSAEQENACKSLPASWQNECFNRIAH